MTNDQPNRIAIEKKVAIKEKENKVSLIEIWIGQKNTFCKNVTIWHAKLLMV
jgi:hypothetical protein